jgi:IS30 family transposase
VKVREIHELEAWINDYPQKILGWRSAGQLFAEEMAKIAC